MEIGTSIVVASAWLMVAAYAVAPNITNAGMATAVRRVWLISALAVTFDIITKYANIQ